LAVLETGSKKGARFMKEWEIKVLYLGHSVGPKSILTPNLDEDLQLEFPFLAFLIQGHGRNILVDSGGNERFLIDGKGWAGMEFHVGRKYFDKAFEDVNVAPDEIDTVIYTHLHNDHTGFSYEFKNARIIVQKKEWATILNPIPPMLVRRDYDLEAISELKTTNLTLIDGDMDVVDGIRVFQTPGHTPGSQSVAVNTKKGVVALVGDQFHLACMAFPKMNRMLDMNGNTVKITPAPEVYGPFYPHSLVYNYYDFYDSGYKILSIIEKNDPSYMIGGHEPGLVATGI
jgi:glyoxylase-like metal-dependent hydrolase (beta-lactamase superfamily II)